MFQHIPIFDFEYIFSFSLPPWKGKIVKIHPDFTPSHNYLDEYLKLDGNTALAQLGFTIEQYNNYFREIIADINK